MLELTTLLHSAYSDTYPAGLVGGWVGWWVDGSTQPNFAGVWADLGKSHSMVPPFDHFQGEN